MVVEQVQEVYEYVLEWVFGCYLQTPEILATRLTQSCTSVRITTDGLEFTLPALYDFAVTEMLPKKHPLVQPYNHFRRSLYGQQTQVQLRYWGGEVVIADNQQQVEQSIYRLQALTKRR